MTNKENVETIRAHYRHADRILKDCTLELLHRWIQQWVSKMQSKEKRVMQANTAMQNPAQVPQGKKSNYLRKAQVAKELLPKQLCEEILSLLSGIEASTERGNTEFNNRNDGKQRGPCKDLRSAS
jgi:hypothetical protein